MAIGAFLWNICCSMHKYERRRIIFPWNEIQITSTSYLRIKGLCGFQRITLCDRSRESITCSGLYEVKGARSGSANRDGNFEGTTFVCTAAAIIGISPAVRGHAAKPACEPGSYQTSMTSASIWAVSRQPGKLSKQ
jgi:hypothetical protein